MQINLAISKHPLGFALIYPATDLLDYIEYNEVELSDCLITRRAQNEGETTLVTFGNENKLGALPVRAIA